MMLSLMQKMDAKLDARGNKKRVLPGLPQTSFGPVEGDDSEEDDEHPLTRDELHAKTMRGLAKREASTARKGKAGAARAQVKR